MVALSLQVRSGDYRDRTLSVRSKSEKSSYRFSNSRIMVSIGVRSGNTNLGDCPAPPELIVSNRRLAIVLPIDFPSALPGVLGRRAMYKVLKATLVGIAATLDP